MFVRECMTPNPVTTTPATPVTGALRTMSERKIRRLPVLDGHGKLVGIVSDKDLLHASPSPVTSLSVWEITELLGKLTVEKVMTSEVITVAEETPLEEAALIMADRRIGGLPVMRKQALVGIITESDLFKVLLEMLGGRRSGVRLTVSVSGAKGTLARVSSTIFGVGGDIVGLGVSGIGDTSEMGWVITFKVQDVAQDKLVEAVRPVVDEILEVRET